MNNSDLSRNVFMLKGKLAKNGYDWWWHSFTAFNKATGEEKAFFIEYFIINPELTSDRIVLGQQKDRTEPIRPSYFMLKCGAWGRNAKQLHRFYPTSVVAIAEDKLAIATDSFYLSETFMSGSVEVSEKDSTKPEYMCDAGSMEWHLTINKKIAYNVGYGASKFFRKLNAFEMFWHAEGMKTEYCGTVIYDGEEYEVVPGKSYGYADKNWGSDFTSPWVWISSWNMRSRVSGKRLHDSVLEVGGGRPKVAGIALDRKLLIDFYYEGKEYEFNFSKFWMGVRTKFRCYEDKETGRIIWKIETKNKDSVLQIKCYCPMEEMLLVNYEAPDGVKRHNRLWNGGTGYGEVRLFKRNKFGKLLIDAIEFQNAGCEWGEY